MMMMMAQKDGYSRVILATGDGMRETRRDIVTSYPARMPLTLNSKREWEEKKIKAR